MPERKCNQDGCNKEVKYRYTWPGHDETFACEDCAKLGKRISESMGFYVQYILLTEEE